MGMQHMRETRKPQDYVNMERHIWRHNEMKNRIDEAEIAKKRKSLTLPQETRTQTLPIPENQDMTDITPEPNNCLLDTYDNRTTQNSDNENQKKYGGNWI